MASRYSGAFSVEPGESFRMECLDWTDGQVGNNDDANEIKYVNLNRVHVLSGPVYVNGVEPGDLLVVDILTSELFLNMNGDLTVSLIKRMEAVSC